MVADAYVWIVFGMLMIDDRKNRMLYIAKGPETLMDIGNTMQICKH